MAEKDIAEKALTWYNDIFADCVNVYFAINGIARHIRPEDLRDARTWSSYKSHTGMDDAVQEALRDQNRDVAKYWMAPEGDMIISLLGLENQSSIDTYQSMRITGYDGADIRSQIPPRRQKGKRYPVTRPHFALTIILYFGVRRRWPKARDLHARLRVPYDLRPYVINTPVNVLELAWLPEEYEKLFKTEFRHLVHYLRQVRLGEELDIQPEPQIIHMKELIASFKALTHDRQFDDLLPQLSLATAGGVEPNMKMPSLIDAIGNKKSKDFMDTLEGAMKKINLAPDKSEQLRKIMLADLAAKPA